MVQKCLHLAIMKIDMVKYHQIQTVSFCHLYFFNYSCYLNNKKRLSYISFSLFRRMWKILCEYSFLLRSYYIYCSQPILLLFQPLVLLKFESQFPEPYVMSFRYFVLYLHEECVYLILM